MNLINYEIFRQRKNFNPIKLFERNEKLTYEMFCNFFESRFVVPPDTQYYLRVKKAFEENKHLKEHQSSELETKNKEKFSLEDELSITTENSKEDHEEQENQEEETQEEKSSRVVSKRRKSRRKKNEQN